MKMRKILLALLGIVSLVSCDSKNNNTNTDANNNTNTNNSTDTSDEDSEEDVVYEYKYYGDEDSFTAGAVKLSFNSAGNYKYLKGINGKKVALKGFMFSSSPVDGSFIFLSNMPFQTCPFCALNTSELSNCYEIYPQKNKKFSKTSSAICVVGTLEVAPSKSEPFVDLYEYQFISKIVDAEYKILNDSEIQGDFTLRNQFANSTLLTDLYDMLNYVNFCCNWPEYFVNSYEDEYGNEQKGFYLYAADAIHYIQTPNAQWNYGYQDGYFEGLIDRVQKISTTGFEELIAIIQECKATAEYAVSELLAGHYTSQYQYVERFDTNDYIFKMNDETLSNKPDEIYNRFSYWLTSFEM